MSCSAQRRTGASLAVGVLLSTLALTPSGIADELHDRKEQVEGKIHRVEEHLDQSSSELAAAAQRLSEAVTALGAARDRLAETRGELAAAQALDLRMQEELDEAVRDLARARAELAEGRASVSRREEALRNLAVRQYASGGPDLMALSTVFTTQDTTRLTSQLNSYQSVLDKEAATLARLEAAEVLLAEKKAAFQQAKRKVAERRAAAAANLAEKARLESEAERAESRIESLVALRSQARQEAAEAKAEDRRRLQQLEAEKAEVSALLQQRAEEARRQAAARARAAEEARARAEAAREAAQERAAARRAEAARRAAEAESQRPAPQRHRERRSTPPPPPSRPAPPPPVDRGLMYPVDGYITSSYGMRFHPIYHRWTLHDGTDFGASCGTPIRAAASGTVVAAYYNAGYGNRIIMDHGLRDGVGLGTSYNHLSGYSTFVGERVSRGEVIGYVGTTGYSTGCHLHFMVFEDGATVDPMNWL